jgi:uncharacterized protein YdaU (DUF1376 family)
MKAPAFQFYAADFLVGTAMMSAEEVGGYIRLLCYQWTHGSIPDDDAVLCRLTGCGGNAVASIRHKFGIDSAGSLVNARLEEVRHKSVEFRGKQSANAHKRWEKAKNTKPGNATADSLAMPPHMPNGCSSVFSLQSPSNTLRPEVAEEAKQEPKAPKEPKPRQRNELFDALAGFTTDKPETLNSNEHGKIAKALSLIRESLPTVTPDEIRRRGRNYASHFPQITKTAMGLASNWSLAEKPKPEGVAASQPAKFYGDNQS